MISRGLADASPTVPAEDAKATSCVLMFFTCGCPKLAHPL
jgi:hypothetical protein